MLRRNCRLSFADMPEEEAIHSLIIKGAMEHPDRTSLCVLRCDSAEEEGWLEETLTYRELIKQARDAAACLRSLASVGPEVKSIAMHPPCHQHLCTALGRELLSIVSHS
jgi:acyl-CoA synthetase (AMP-forming)/AMP-acid ligase II